MDRIIKFRAYDTKTKTMFSIVDAIKFTKNEDVEVGRTGKQGIVFSIQYKPNIELMQFTGLKDKNGVEIYEGDIVEDYDDEERGTIEWKESDAMFIVKFDNFTQDFSCMDSKWFEVVGNIYENKELLGEGNVKN